MGTPGGVQQRPIDVKKVGIRVDPFMLMQDFRDKRRELPGCFLLERWQLRAPRRPPYVAVGASGGTQLIHIEIKFRDRAGQGISMHAKLLGCLALIAVVLQENVGNEDFLEFAYGLGVKDAALVHLRNQD
jgi:hypothetical protein